MRDIILKRKEKKRKEKMRILKIHLLCLKSSQHEINVRKIGFLK